MQINEEYILLEKIDNHLFKAIINDITKTTIRFTDLDTVRPAIRLLLNVFNEKYEVIEKVNGSDDNSNVNNESINTESTNSEPINTIVTEETNLLYQQLKQQPFNFEPLKITCDTSNTETNNFDADFQNTLNTVINEIGKDKPRRILFEGHQPIDKLNTSNPPQQISTKPITKPLTNNWCILVDENNKYLIQDWLGFEYKPKVGNYYGINKFGNKHYTSNLEGWQNTFSELITTEQFSKYILNKNTEVIVDNNVETYNFNEINNTSVIQDTEDDENLYVTKFNKYNHLEKNESPEHLSWLEPTVRNNTKEVWKSVKETGGLYEFSNLGKLRKINNGRIMSPNNGGYSVMINKISKYLSINSLNRIYFEQ
jgi:hypothetical protein